MTDNYTQSPKWTRRQLFGTLSAAVAHLEEWGACGVMVQRADLEAWATEREELREANARLREALRSIEHDARLSANPARAHSGQVSYDELLAGYAEIADAARALLEGGA